MSREVFEQEAPSAFKVDLSDVFNLKEESALIDERDIPSEEPIEEAKEADPLEVIADDPYADYTDFAKIALLEAREGFFNLPEKEIPKDIDALGLKELYRKNIEQEIELEKQRFYDQAGNAAEYLKILLDGGDPNDIQGMIKTDEILSIDINDVENQKLVIKSHLYDLGIPETDIEELVENTFDKGKGRERAEQAMAFYKNVHDQMYEQNRQALQQQELLAQQQRETITTNIKSVIDNGVIGGYEIDKHKQVELYDAIFKPTERVEYQDQYGRKQVVKLPKIELLANKIKTDIPTYVSYALWLLEGGNFNFAKSQASDKRDDDLRSLLQGKKTIGKSETNNNNTGPKRKVFEWPNGSL